MRLFGVSDRYRFQSGDYVTTLDGAKIFVRDSYGAYVDAYVVKRSLVYQHRGLCKVSYKDLPYYKQGEFVNNYPKERVSAFWVPYTLVRFDSGNVLLLLLDEVEHQTFFAYVLKSSSLAYVKNTTVRIVNPFKCYVKRKG